MDLHHLHLTPGWLLAVAITYGAWLLVNPLLSTYPYASLAGATQLALLPLGFIGWLIQPNQNKRSLWRPTWQLLLLCGAAIAVWGISDYFIYKTSAHGPLIDANAYAALINLFLVPTAFAYLNEQPIVRNSNRPYLELSAIVLLALALFASLSRGGLLAFLAVLPVVLWQNRNRRTFRSRCTLLLILLLSAYTVVKISPLETQKGIEKLLMAPAHQLETDTSIQTRFLIWKTTWNIVQNSNLVIGTGLGTFKNYYATYRDPAETNSSGNLAHNDYLQALQEGGLIQLTFLITLILIAPCWLLFKHRRNYNGRNSSGKINSSAGLLLSIVCISIHALVNFIQFVAPIALLTGFYLARAWEIEQPRREFRLLPRRFPMKSYLPKSAIIGLLAVPVFVLALDGIIFKTLSTRNPLLIHMDERQRFELLNVALTLRPGNPIPRAVMIQDLLEAAHTSSSRVLREQFLTHAEQEASALAAVAPALASGWFFLGKTQALKGTPGELQLARENLERAVKLVPPASGMRLELVKVYQRLGLDDEAYQAVLNSKKWLPLEKDYRSLAAFALEARLIAVRQQNENEVEFWSWVYHRLFELGVAS